MNASTPITVVELDVELAYELDAFLKLSKEHIAGSPDDVGKLVNGVLHHFLATSGEFLDNLIASQAASDQGLDGQQQ